MLSCSPTAVTTAIAPVVLTFSAIFSLFFGIHYARFSITQEARSQGGKRCLKEMIRSSQRPFIPPLALPVWGAAQRNFLSATRQSVRKKGRLISIRPHRARSSARRFDSESMASMQRARSSRNSISGGQIPRSLLRLLEAVIVARMSEYIHQSHNVSVLMYHLV